MSTNQAEEYFKLVTPPRPSQPQSSAPTPTERERATTSTKPPARAAPILPRRAYDDDGVKKTRKDSLGTLNLVGDAAKQEVKTNYRKIAQI